MLSGSCARGCWCRDFCGGDIAGARSCDDTLPHFFCSRGSRHTRWPRDWSSDVCSSDRTRHGRHFQRVRVTFTSTGSPLTRAIAAGECEAQVRVDGVRVVPFTAPEDPEPTEATVLFEDFENVDIGYWPFVTGADNIGGDARTQLAERHEPYSQAGWYGLDEDGEVGAGENG